MERTIIKNCAHNSLQNTDTQKTDRTWCCEEQKDKDITNSLCQVMYNNNDTFSFWISLTWKRKNKIKGLVNHNTCKWSIPVLADARKEEEERMNRMRKTQKKLRLVWRFIVLDYWSLGGVIVMNTNCMSMFVYWCVPLYIYVCGCSWDFQDLQEYIYIYIYIYITSITSITSIYVGALCIHGLLTNVPTFPKLLL